MDDDSYMTVPPELIIQPNDHLILSHEPHAYFDDCYIEGYHLTHPIITNHTGFEDWAYVYGNRILINWAMFSIPRHPYILRVLTNLVEIIRLEYLTKEIIWMTKHHPRWKLVHCATGPRLLTATIHEIWAESNQTELDIRMVSKDFKTFGGEFTTRDYSIESKHYMLQMNKYHTPLLNSYFGD